MFDASSTSKVCDLEQIDRVVQLLGSGRPATLYSGAGLST